MLDHDDEDAVKLARSARLQLWVALVCAVLVLFTVFANKTTVFATFWILSFLAGASGIRDASRATGGNALMMYLAIVAVFMPILSLLPIVAYLAGVTTALKAGDAPPARVPTRAPPRAAAARTPQPATPPAQPGAAPSGSRPSPPPGPQAARPVQRPSVPPGVPPGVLASPGPSTHAELFRAIAAVRNTLFPADGHEIPDGTVLEARVSDPRVPAGTDIQPVIRATAGLFAVFYLVDRGDHFVMVNKSEVEAAGLTREQLHTAGLFNLAQQVNGKPGLRILPQGSFNGLVMGGDHEASLVLLDDLWDDSLKEYYKTAPVVAIPVKDICAFCDENSAEGIERLRAIIDRHVKQGDKIICDKLLVRRNGRWQVFAPEKKADLPPLEFKT
jgi:hypothetical protein